MKNYGTEEIFIYVLELNGGKYYVGQSNNVERRFKQHCFTQRGHEWTRIYSPKSILQTYRTGFTDPLLALKVENDITFSCIKEFGWKNVRGGDFCQVPEEEHLLSLTDQTDLGNAICPIENHDNIEITNYKSCVFVLKLEENKYFVGRTENLSLAILSEFNGYGSPWTIRFKPQELISVINTGRCEKQELRNVHNEVVKITMLKYGFENVRGGDYYRIEPSFHKHKVYHSFNIRELN